MHWCHFRKDHYNDVMWSLRRLSLPTTGLPVGNIKFQTYISKHVFFISKSKMVLYFVIMNSDVYSSSSREILLRALKLSIAPPCVHDWVDINDLRCNSTTACNSTTLEHKEPILLTWFICSILYANKAWVSIKSVVSTGRNFLFMP